MTTHARSFFCLAAVSLSLAAFVGCQSAGERQAPETSLQVGAAELDVTPPVGYRMAGYFNERISTAIHDPLHAKAIVMQQGRVMFAFVFTDMVGVSLDTTSKARELASKQTGIPVPNIVICATHSHTGPLYDGPLRDYFHAAAIAKLGTDPHEKVDYPAFLVEQWVRVIAAAKAHLRPAELEAGIAQQEGLSFNRRYWMKNGKVVFNPGRLNTNIVEPAGPIDPDVGILLARRSDAKEPFAGMTVFAVHSDTVGGTLFSADYEYYLEQTLRGAFGPDFISAFGLGTCGDINHINVKEADTLKGFARAEHIGNTLGQTVIEASKHLDPITHPALDTASTTIRVPLKDVTPEQVAGARATLDRLSDTNIAFLAKVEAVGFMDLARMGPSWPMEVQVFRLDADTAMVCLPCEIFVELGLEIKRDSPFKKTFVVEICNDRPSYVPTMKAFGEGSYEVTNARVKPGAGEMLVNAAVSLLKELKD
jgi:neutral ceramidase